MIYNEIASKLAAIAYVKARGSVNKEHWIDIHTENIRKLVNDNLPSGSGFDAGTALDFYASTPERLVFITAYHHMRDGSYTYWTEHKVIVTPSLVSGFNLKITGRDRNNIKEYIADCFNNMVES